MLKNLCLIAQQNNNNFSEQNRLTSVNFNGTPVTRPVLDPLAVLSLNNRLQISYFYLLDLSLFTHIFSTLNCKIKQKSNKFFFKFYFFISEKRLKPDEEQHRPRKSSTSSGNLPLPQGSQSTTTAASSSLPNRSKSDRSSVKSEPLEGSASSYYSSHFSGSKPLQESASMLHGLPQLTPAPFSSHSHHHQHYHQGFSLTDDVKYHNPHAGAQHHHSSLPYPHHGYGSFHSSSNGANTSGMFYTGLPEHSSKLNLQAS